MKIWIRRIKIKTVLSLGGKRNSDGGETGKLKPVSRGRASLVLTCTETKNFSHASSALAAWQMKCGDVTESQIGERSEAPFVPNTGRKRH